MNIRNNRYVVGFLVGVFVTLIPLLYIRTHVIEIATNDILDNDLKKSTMITKVNPDFLTTITKGY